MNKVRSIFRMSGKAVMTLLLFWSIGFEKVESAEYVSPDISKELFEVANVGLTDGQVKSLSKNFVTMAKRDQKALAHQRRTSAQFISLALWLDKSNQEAHDLNELLSEGSFPDFVSEGALKEAEKNIESYQSILSSSEELEDAKTLSNCMTDAMKGLGLTVKKRNELVDWSGVVPAISTYIDKVADNSKPAVVGSGFCVKKSSINTFFYLPKKIGSSSRSASKSSDKDAKDKVKKVRQFRFAPVSVVFNVSEEGTESRLSSKSRQSSQSKQLEKLKSNLDEFLAEFHEGLPSYNALIKSPNFSDENQKAVDASLAMLFEASILDVPLRRDIYLGANLGGDNLLTEVSRPLPMLDLMSEVANAEKSDSKKQAGLVIIPPGYEEVLMMEAVMNKSSFFIHWEVYSTSELDKAVSLAALKPSENIKKARELFKTIQGLYPKMRVSAIVHNKAVKERLKEIVRLCPEHYSAKALLMQGGERAPTKISRRAMALKLLGMVDFIYKYDLKIPLSYRSSYQSGVRLVDYEYYTGGFSAQEFEAFYTEEDKALKSLSRWVPHEDKALFDRSVALLNDYRSLGVALKSLAGREEMSYDSSLGRTVFNTSYSRKKSSIINKDAELIADARQLFEDITKKAGIE